MKELLAAVLTLALQHPTMPAGMSHEEHLKQMALKARGALAMGFDQDKTVHRFPSSATGGSIEVEVKDPADSVSRDQIRTHLKEIAGAFAKGDFAKPFQTHAEVPSGSRPSSATCTRKRREEAWSASAPRIPMR
jgi:hypothetical protein